MTDDNKFFKTKMLTGILLCFIIDLPAWLAGKTFPLSLILYSKPLVSIG